MTPQASGMKAGYLLMAAEVDYGERAFATSPS